VIFRLFGIRHFVYDLSRLRTSRGLSRFPPRGQYGREIKRAEKAGGEGRERKELCSLQ